MYSKGFVNINNKPFFDRKFTFIDHVHIFLLGVRILSRMLAGIRNRRSGLTYCNVTDIC